MSHTPEELSSMIPKELMDVFPEAKLTIRDRIPTNILLLYTFMKIDECIKNIQYSSDELREIILALICKIPDELRDDKFEEELRAANLEIMVDNRPEFCGVKASLEYCQKVGIQPYVKIQQLNYFQLYHAVFNLLMRKHMLLQTQPKEIATGLPATGKEFNVNQEDEEE